MNIPPCTLYRNEFRILGDSAPPEIIMKILIDMFSDNTTIIP